VIDYDEGNGNKKQQKQRSRKSERNFVAWGKRKQKRVVSIPREFEEG
jgi:hypothetical protein